MVPQATWLTNAILKFIEDSALEDDPMAVFRIGQVYSRSKLCYLASETVSRLDLPCLQELLAIGQSMSLIDQTVCLEEIAFYKTLEDVRPSNNILGSQDLSQILVLLALQSLQHVILCKAEVTSFLQGRRTFRTLTIKAPIDRQ